MTYSYATIAFTPVVKALQCQNGSREKYAVIEKSVDQTGALTQREVNFIETRDSFYQATVSETGWPYVQHRGGPQGFLKVLDNRTIAYADFRGNQQYLSVGNLVSNDRIALIMVDYVNQRRLKLLAHARVLLATDEPQLLARLSVPSYPARVERGFILHVEAWDWNCSQHITPRFKENEVKSAMDQMLP
jgi:hypothetical protein